MSKKQSDRSGSLSPCMQKVVTVDWNFSNLRLYSVDWKITQRVKTNMEQDRIENNRKYQSVLCAVKIVLSCEFFVSCVDITYGPDIKSISYCGPSQVKK